MESIEIERLENYVELYDEIREKTESDEAAVAIFQEMGKDKRSNRIREERSSVQHKPATEKQKRLMRKLGMNFPDGLTTKEASELLRQELKSVND